ncbi:TlpA family protein disulfide reductase [Fodinibius sp. SL11]|uniref:TlpA family protein disulfide reductase n=1 Tax=Fodinibius sp. SL11 TaxID=3425690 RepID=UPI003F8815DD
MKRLSFLTFFLLLTTSVLAQNQLTVFYFGATSCGPCNRPEVIESIDKLKAEFDSIHPKYNTKFVMVVFDEDMETGLEFIEKYDYWDEVSIGSRYDNELSLDNLNKTDIPGLPHILIYEETFEPVGDWGIEVRESKKLVKEILEGTKVVSWVNSGMKLD